MSHAPARTIMERKWCGPAVPDRREPGAGPSGRPYFRSSVRVYGHLTMPCPKLREKQFFESLWVTFPAACGVSPGLDQRLRQEARPGLPEAPREPPIGSLPKYLAACGGGPLLPTASGECVTSCALKPRLF